jgi:hypothetical protein
LSAESRTIESFLTATLRWTQPRAEDVLHGFDVNVPKRRAVWRITRQERHGIKNLSLGTFTADMLCQPRAKATDRCHISVNSGGPFTLVIITPRQRVTTTISKGAYEFVVE